MIKSTQCVLFINLLSARRGIPWYFTSKNPNTPGYLIYIANNNHNNHLFLVSDRGNIILTKKKDLKNRSDNKLYWTKRLV